MRRKPKGWNWAEIKHHLTLRGMTFADVDRLHGLKVGTSRATCRHPHLAGEKAIAKTLGIRPHQIWPSRFDPFGKRLSPQPRENYTDRPRLLASQKAKAA